MFNVISGNFVIRLNIYFLVSVFSVGQIEFVRDPSGRSSRFMLASVILRLLGSRVVYGDMDFSLNTGRGSPVTEAELQMETCAEVSFDLSGKNLFEWLLLVLHALLSSSQTSWLRT